MNRRTFGFWAISSVLALALSSFALGGEVIGKSIATVNGEAIFMSEFQGNWDSFVEHQKTVMPADEMTPEWVASSKRGMLDQMVDEKLLSQEAKNQNIKVAKRQVEQGVLQIKNRFKNFAPGKKPGKEDYERELTATEKAEFDKELKRQGVTEKEFVARVEDQLRVMQYTENTVRKDVPSPFKDAPAGAGEDDERELTPEFEQKTKAYFSQIEKKFNDPKFKPEADEDMDQVVMALKNRLCESVHARHILIRSSKTDDAKKRAEALARIRSIKKDIEGGADFIDMARQHSQDPNPRSPGDLGFFSRGQMVPEFEAVAFALPVGGLSDVVETDFGYHLIKVEEKKAARKLRYEDIRMDIAAFLYQSDMKARYEKMLADLRKKADIKILVDFSKDKKS